VRRWLLSFAPVVLLLTSTSANSLQAVDLDGRAVDVFRPSADRRATVLVFTSTDCPISNRYAPEVHRLHDAYAARGVRFLLVYANASDQPSAIREHVKAFGYGVDAVRDPRHELVRLAQATVTPEVAVFDQHAHLVYHGRIDDRYADFGVDRPVPTRRDLQDTLDAMLAGTPVPASSTRAVGCFIGDLSSEPSPITFTKDIAPLVFDRCGTCHRPTGPAPFSLLRYAEVKQRAKQIVTATESRFMPPWKADPESGPFVGQKPLSSAERDVIRRWVEAGAPEGDARELPPAPTWTDDWQLGKPDLVVTVPDSYELQAETSDVFRIFALPLPIDGPRYVRGIEFRPGNARVVHHANIRIDRTPASRALDDADPSPGYDGLMPRTAEYPDGHFLGWTPGQVAPLVAADLAWRLDPGTDLVLQLHMQPSGKVEHVQPSIGIYFSNTPPTRIPSILRLGSQGIDIAPGEAHHVISDRYVLPVDVTLLAVQPHAHYRAREIVGTATLPDGTTRSLIHITQWDFRWQHVYRYETPIALPRGTTLAMQYTFDNSAENPRNPQQPPGRVLWGQRSKDEMGDLWFQLLAGTDRDRAVLNQQARAKMFAEDITGYETMLIADPSDAELHDDVAVLYLGTNRANDAVRHFAASLAIKPDSAAAHFNLATALSVASRLPEAVAEYRRALALRPDYVSARNNFGSVLASLGERREAIEQFREALRLDPTHTQAMCNLGWHLAVSDESTSADREEAVTLGERAVALTSHRDQYALDVLAAAYAGTAQYSRAAATARDAVALDPTSALVPSIRERLALYTLDKAFKEKSKQ
jgi:tetratricopeptide (TPR) repeat protein